MERTVCVGARRDRGPGPRGSCWHCPHRHPGVCGVCDVVDDRGAVKQCPHQGGRVSERERGGGGRERKGGWRGGVSTDIAAAVFARGRDLGVDGRPLYAVRSMLYALCWMLHAACCMPTLVLVHHRPRLPGCVEVGSVSPACLVVVLYPGLIRGILQMPCLKARLRQCNAVWPARVHED